MRCLSLVVFAFHCFYGFCFPFAVDGCRYSTPVRDGEALFRLLCLGALFQDMGGEPLLENSFSEVQGAIIFHLFCNYRVTLQMLLVASAIQALVNVLALLWSHPPFLLLATQFSPCAGHAACAGML